MRTARIVGTGFYLPREVSNEELFELLKQKGHEWVFKYKTGEEFSKWGYGVSGIKSRHYATEETTEDMAYHAAIMALNEAGVSPKDVGRIILNTITPSWQVPSAGILLQNMLGATHAASETINQACAGFVWGMSNAYYLIKGGYEDPLLVVSADSLSRVRRLLETQNSILFGDGASACVIVPSEDRGFLGAPILHSLYSEDITLDRLYDQFIFKGMSVAKAAIRGMASIAEEALKTTSYGLSDVAYVIPHQANGRFAKGIAEQLKLPEDRIINVIENIGNNSGATVGIALDMLRKGKIMYNGTPLKLKENDLLVFTAIGGGYTEAAVVYQV